VFDEVAAEANQPPGFRHDIKSSVAKVNPELASVFVLPILVEVAYQGEFAAIPVAVGTGAKLIKVALITTSDRINRAVNLHVFQAQEQILVKKQQHSLYAVEVCGFSRGSPLRVNPLDEIAAYAFNDLPVCLANARFSEM
jgi:hypothetical protein